MGINYDEPYCQGITFGEIPNELDPNATEYLPMKNPNPSEEIVSSKTEETELDDDSTTKASDKNPSVLGATETDVQLLNGLWLPELNGYSLINNSTQFESYFNENIGNFPYDSLRYGQYVPGSQNLKEVSKISDDTIFFNSQNIFDYPANYTQNCDQPNEISEMHPVPSDSSGFNNQNIWITYNNDFVESSQTFPNQTTFFEQPVFLEIPPGNFYQNSPYQTCINGNFNTVNIPNNFVPNNYITNNSVNESFIPNNFVPSNCAANNYAPNNYAQTNYVQVNNSQTYGMPAAMEKFPHINSGNSGLTNMNTQVHYSNNNVLKPHQQPIRNSSSTSYRKTLSSWKQPNKGYNPSQQSRNEQPIRNNDQRTLEFKKTEFQSNIRDNYKRPPYVRRFSNSNDDCGQTTQLAVKSQEFSLPMKNRESFPVKTEEYNTSRQNFKARKAQHPYKQTSTTKKNYCSKDDEFPNLPEIKESQLKENLNSQKPNSYEASFQPKEIKGQNNHVGSFSNSEHPSQPYRNTII